MGSRCTAVLCLASLASSACGRGAAAYPLADPDAQRFANEVYPVLLRDCAMPSCHGSTRRFFRVVGPGRVRLSDASRPLDPATDAEIAASYDRAIAFIEPNDYDASLLLRKPLAPEAGGAAHEGDNAFSRNVYASKTDAGYAAIAAWVRGESSGATP